MLEGDTKISNSLGAISVVLQKGRYGAQRSYSIQLLGCGR